MYLSLIITFLLVLGIVVVSIQNNVSIDLEFFFWKLQLSLAALMFYSAMIGAAIVAVLTLPKLVNRYLKVRSLKREIAVLKRKTVELEKLQAERSIEE